MSNYTINELEKIANKYPKGPLSIYVNLKLFDNNDDFNYDTYNNLNQYLKDLLDEIPINFVVTKNDSPILLKQPPILLKQYSSYMISISKSNRCLPIINIIGNSYNYFPIKGLYGINNNKIKKAYLVSGIVNIGYI